ncbi:hypothetical protein [Desulfocucumis palustris]|nr:hypothetical protein [Desulfocucumis palustris]
MEEVSLQQVGTDEQKEQAGARFQAEHPTGRSPGNKALLHHLLTHAEKP